MPPTEPKRLAWPSCYNVRDLGGHCLPDGRYTRSGVLVRADNLSRLTGIGWDALVEYGVRTVIDLRADSELDIELCPYLETGAAIGVIYHHLPFLTDVEFGHMPEKDSASARYTWMVSAAQTRIASIMTTMVRAADGVVLFHCHSGKDRTGIIAALLLALAGVPNCDIATDYALSSAYLQPFQHRWLAQGPGERADREREAARSHTTPETMLCVLEHLDSHSNGAERYLLGGGMTAGDITILRDRIAGPMRS